MSNQRKRTESNERIQDAHERKLWTDEDKRIARMSCETSASIAHKQNRANALKLLAFAAANIQHIKNFNFSI